MATALQSLKEVAPAKSHEPSTSGREVCENCLVASGGGYCRFLQQRIAKPVARKAQSVDDVHYRRCVEFGILIVRVVLIDNEGKFLGKTIRKI